jgi:hypothetical protein
MEWSAQVDEFDATCGDVTITILVRQTISASDAGGSSGFVHGPPVYSTSTGLAVDRVDSRHFRLVGTGDVFERVR